MRYSVLLLSLLFLSACGGGGGAASVEPNNSNNQSTINKDYTNYLPTANFNLEDSLYNSSYLKFTPQNSSSIYVTNIGFSSNWNQGFLGTGIILAILDTGTSDLSKLAFNNHYEYKEVDRKHWKSLDYRLKNTNFTANTYKSSVLINEKTKAKATHGMLVMNTANHLAKDIRFANVPLPLLDAYKNKLSSGDDINLAATIDYLSNSGIRFFNRSFAEIGEINKSEELVGNFYPAIMQNNALIVSSAGNEETTGDFSAHALPINSPLRKGWIIALGYYDEKPKKDYKNIYYIMDNGVKKYVYSAGNTCKKYGWDDCIAAPFLINNNAGTSFSAPAILTLGALIYEKYPWMSNDNIKESIFTTAYKVYGASASDIKAHFGEGIINPAKAMNGVASLRHDFNANVDIDNLYVFSNDISGNAGLIKDGIGTLALSGKNTFTGDISIKKGVLWLSNSNKASITNNSILRMSNASAANLTNNGILVNEGMEVNNLKLANTSVVYTNIGEKFNVINKAILNGDLNVVGVKYGYTLNKERENILTAGSIEGEFKNIKPNSTFLKLSEPIYDKNNLSIKVDKIDDLNTLPELNAYAKKNYTSLFSKFDRLLYETKKPDLPLDKANYKEVNLNGGLSESEFLKYNMIANAIINTTKDELASTTKLLFAEDIYTNSILNIARIKSLNKINFDNFGVSYNYNKISDLKESSSEYKIANNFDNLGLAFVYNDARIYNDNFKNNSRTLGFLAGYKIDLDDYYSKNLISYFDIKNNANRFDLSSKFKNKAFLISSELGLNNNISPYFRLNYLKYFQDSFNENSNLLALSFNKFNKDFYYANLGINSNFAFKKLNLKTYADLEYNFNKDYYFLAKYDFSDELKISNGFYKQYLFNLGINLSYRLNSKINFNFDYNNSFAKNYFANKFNLGFLYEF
ncbi:S8 family serine peptidase [Campylobacter sp. RM9334]|uniref:S8 family serine peptidase n=1 Tax=Campylobacter sp. RM9334 TaxID=2735732 RepID=UPI001D2020CD|nr:S8 family serine peptidase [Campylobacter sp. RM9334]